MLPKQATDGGKDIWRQISTNVPSTQYDAQMFIRNSHEVGKWKLERKLLSAKPLPMPYCKHPVQPPMSSMNTWFYYSFLVLEDAQKCLCSALKPQVIDIFFKIYEQYFQLMYFCENVFSSSFSHLGNVGIFFFPLLFPILSFTFNMWFYLSYLIWWESELNIRVLSKMYSLKHLNVLGILY